MCVIALRTEFARECARLSACVYLRVTVRVDYIRECAGASDTYNILAKRENSSKFRHASKTCRPTLGP